MVKRTFSTTARLAPYLLLLLSLLLFSYTLNTFPFPTADAAYSDLVITHYPYALYLRQAILDGRVPLWLPGILSGAPFAANPLSGLWYPPGWISLLLPLPLGFNLLVALHLAWGGLGMYKLLREEGLSNGAALIGALAFAWLPKLFAHYGAGHLTLLYAVPWTPWLLWAGCVASGGGNKTTFSNPDSTMGTRRQAADRSPKTGGFDRQQHGVNHVRWSYWEALFLALIFLADVRWSFYACALWLVYRAYSLAQGRGSLVRGIGSMLEQILLAGLLAAPLGLPFIEFAHLSSRAIMTVQDVLTFSLPPPRLLGLFFPDFGGFHEFMLYPGSVVLVLSVLAAIGVAVGKRARFWLGVALAALIFSLGAYLPPLALLARMPLVNLLRVPSRALFIAGLSLAALAASAVEWLLVLEPSVQQGQRKTAPPGVRLAKRPARAADRVYQAAEIMDRQGLLRRRAGLALATLATFSLSLTTSLAIFTGLLPPNFAWGAALTLASVAWIGLRLGGRVACRPWLVGLAILCLLDLGRMDFSLFVPRPASAVLAEGKELAEYLENAPISLGAGRVYSPSYSLPQQTAAAHGLEQADGVDPMQLQSYVKFMQEATGVPWEGYSVTVPPFATGNTRADNAAYRPDPARLGLLNVRFVAAEFDLDVNGLLLLQRFGDTRVYVNQRALGRAWVDLPGATDELAGTPIEPAEHGEVTGLVSWSPERIELNASGPGLLVLSEIAYPGWRVWVDRKPAQVETVHGLLRGVQLAEGGHQVIFAFRPFSLYLGFGLWGIAIVYSLGSFVLRRKVVEAAPPLSRKIGRGHHATKG